MAHFDWRRDPLGQLNLVLWASMPAPRHAPLFRREFEPVALSYPLPMPMEMRLRREKALLQGLRHFGESPSPDVVLANRSDKGLLIECKKQSFGVDSSTSGQARALLAVAATIAQHPTLPLSAGAHVAWCVPDEDASAQAQTAQRLTEELVSLGWQSGAAHVLALSVEPDGIAMRAVHAAGDSHPRLRDWQGPELVVPLEEGDEPMALLLVPWEPDSADTPDLDQRNREFLAHRLAQHLYAWIGRESPGTVQIPIATFLDGATQRLARLWPAKAQRRYEEMVREVLKGWSAKAKVVHRFVREENALQIEVPDEAARDHLLRTITHEGLMQPPRQTELPI